MEVSERVGRLLRERRRSGPPRRVLFLRHGRWPEGECLQAFRALGFAVREIHLAGHEDGAASPRLLQGLAEFLPDFLFCINYPGFDHAGGLTFLLTEAHLPAATWFVDNPDFILNSRTQNVSDWLMAFAWDQYYVEELQKKGFPWVSFLPLATDTRLFRPYRHPPVERFGILDAAFVGHTWARQVQDHLAPFAGRPALLAYIEAAARTFQWSPHYRARADLAEVMPGFENLPLNEQVALETAVIWKAAQQDRLERVSSLIQAGLMVFGDSTWTELLPDPLAYGGLLSYDRELPAFYQCVAVNLNFTGLQTKNGLNQRVFDVPAAGAFLLTDHKEALWQIFAPDEMVTFRTLEEALDKLAFYLKYHETRRQIAARARERVVSQHTYGHRIQAIVNRLTEVFFS
ncbi:MAG: CgeB family protein [Desulfobaccales bacterium]